jgi:uncharacterized pyridoxal phosphate-containing UPF0001 family protein
MQAPEESIAGRLAAVRARCDAAALAAGRDPAGVRIVAVSKRMPAEAVLAAWQAGQRDFGENYVQEAMAKIEATRAALAGAAEEARWHFIGRLQSNKAAAVARSFAMVHGVDSLRGAAALAKAARAEGRVLDVLMQVRLGRRGAPAPGQPPGRGGAEQQPSGGTAEQAAARGGVEMAEAEAFLRAAAAPDALRFAGLMGVADPDEPARPQFAALAALSRQLVAAGIDGAPLGGLSMGMTADLEDAVAEGATIVRIGTAIFGERQVA